METKNIVIAIVVGVIMFVAGGASGILYQMQKNTAVLPQTQNTISSTNTQLIKQLSSKVIPFITAHGTVVKINGNAITLNYQGDNATITMKSDAKIYSFVSNIAVPAGSLNKTPSVSKEITFKDIKVGDNVNISANVFANGTLEGFSAVVVPLPVNSFVK